MNSLDRLAYAAADAIDASVAQVPVPIWGARAPVLHQVRQAAGYALAGAAAAVFAVFALLVVAPPAEESTNVTPSTVAAPTTVVSPTTSPVNPTIPPTSIPSNPDGVVPVPLPDGSDRTPGADTDPPAIVIVSPEPGQHFETDTAAIEGFTEIGAVVRSGDGQRIAVDHEGHWRHDVVLEPGSNRFGFFAIDASGNEGSAAIEIVRDVPPPTTTTTRPKVTTTTEGRTWEFTAHNTYGTCAESPPYDVFYGTGKPGTEISVTSEFGSGSTVVSETGEWEVKVYFPSAPLDTQFQVKVRDFTGAKKLFEFTHTSE